jgi:16S rRNA (cytidine1402-2'-O)-methyltransferase
MPKLYVVPTPIGNLEDITIRAIRILKESDLILAEDTRKTGILLNRYGVEKKMMPHHAFNEHATLKVIVEKIRQGMTIALVSDAGTPSISDPGYLLVRECLKEGLEVECLPGPTAFVPALVNSGLRNWLRKNPPSFFMSLLTGWLKLWNNLQNNLGKTGAPAFQENSRKFMKRTEPGR